MATTIDATPQDLFLFMCSIHDSYHMLLNFAQGKDFFFFLVVFFFMMFPRHYLLSPEIYAVRSLCRSPPFFIQVILGDLARYLQWCQANCSSCGSHFLYDGLQLNTIPLWCAQCALQWCKANCSSCGSHFLYDSLQVDTIPLWCAQCAEESLQFYYDEEMVSETFFVEQMPPEIYAMRSLCRSPPCFIQVILGELARYLQWCEANCSCCGYLFLYDGLHLDTIPRWCAQCSEESLQLYYDEEMELETFFVERGSVHWNNTVIELGIVTSFFSDDFSTFTALRYE